MIGLRRNTLLKRINRYFWLYGMASVLAIRCLIERWLSRSLCVSVFVVWSSLYLLACNNPNLKFEAGSKIQNISFQQSDGSKRELKDFIGRPFILLFWASWCETCKGEMPSLIRLKERFASKGFDVVAIAVSDDFNNVKKYLSEAKLNFTIGFDHAGSISELYKLTGVPEAFVVDKEGRFVLIQDPESGDAVVRIIGPRAWDLDLLASQVNRLLL